MEKEQQKANWHHIWLSEGFATYFTILYLEQKYGKERAREELKANRLQILENDYSQANPVVNTKIEQYMELLNANSYQKGGWVLHMLRQEVGDAAFWEAIQKYYNEYKLSNALTEDLQAVFEEVSGKDLNGFFKQWIYQAGQPDIRVVWTIENDLEIHVYQEQQGVFTFPFEVMITYTDGSSERKLLDIKKAEETFKFKVDKHPMAVTMDPDVKLLFITDDLRK